MDKLPEQLKPCPFCGCMPVHGVLDGDFDDGAKFVIDCPDCPCSMRFFSSTREQAISRWNDRTFGDKAALAAAAPVAETDGLMHAIYENRKVAFEFYKFAPDAVGAERDAARKALMVSDAQLRALLAAAAPVAAPECCHTTTIKQRFGDGKTMEFCRDCGTSRMA